MWLVSYRDWFPFSDCSLCCYIFLYIRRNVVETVTDGNLMEAICHCCPGGKNISSVDCNLHVRRRRGIGRTRGVASWFRFYSLFTISCVVQKYYEWLPVTCKEDNKNTEAIGKMRNKFMESATYSILLLLPLALQPTVGFGLSNNVLPFFPICHQFSPSSHSQHLKISFYFLFQSFPGSSPSSLPFQFLSEDIFGYPILLHSL